MRPSSNISTSWSHSLEEESFIFCNSTNIITALDRSHHIRWQTLEDLPVWPTFGESFYSYLDFCSLGSTSLQLEENLMESNKYNSIFNLKEVGRSTGIEWNYDTKIYRIIKPSSFVSYTSYRPSLWSRQISDLRTYWNPQYLLSTAECFDCSLRNGYQALFCYYSRFQILYYTGEQDFYRRRAPSSSASSISILCSPLGSAKGGVI